jgi:uncharacterized damage-inducible protein DinB/D-arabinose 5-phosphate isomerase GutQ
MLSIIEMLINHNSVCRDPLFQTLEQLGSEEFLKPTGAGKGSVRDILVHIMNAEKFWIAFLKELEYKMSEPERFLDIRGIKNEWSKVSAETEEFIRNLPENHLQHVRNIRSGDRTISFTVAKALLHVTTHETHHRGFLIGLIRQKGLEPPRCQHAIVWRRCQMTEFLEICYDSIKKQEQAIPRTIDAVDETATSVIENKKQIVLTGCGDSYAVADYGRWAFLRIGINAHVVSPDEIRNLRLNKDSVVIGISASGRSLVTINALQKAKSLGATSVVLTDNKDGTASQEANHVWVTKSGVRTYNTSPQAPTTTAMVYLLAVSAGIDNESRERLDQDIEQLKKSGKELMDWAEREGITISQMTSPNVPIYLISEGPNHVAAQIGMMKFNEFSVLKGIAAIREEFRHHYVLSINNNDSAVLVTRNPIDTSDDVYMRTLTNSLKMRAYHLHTNEKLGLQFPLVQTIPNVIALQMAAYYSVLKNDPDKDAFKLPNIDAFKIY